MLRSAWQAWQEIQVVHGNLKPEEARSSDEVFATSTAGGIIPITRIDGQIINSGLIGPVTQKLQDGYWMLHNETKYSSVINY
ncbi:MAG: Branched-chain-amino-acid aminotransferase [Deltaproteobacteria bacterium]|nr:Branched-chain-amino-acid aminotransferase [Deltaproteobacteria bacterium]